MKLHTYVMFAGNCEEAINFYKDVLDGEITELMRYADMPPGHMEVTQEIEDHVMHCTLKFHGNMLMASDNLGPDYTQGNAYHLSIDIEDVEEAVSVFNSLADGGKVAMPFEDAFWGGKFGMLTDRFGVGWMVSSEHKAV